MTDVTQADNRPFWFISYAEPDRVWAEWVAQEIEDAGLHVELDMWDWSAGDNALLRLNRALERGRVLALFSAAYFDPERSTAMHWAAVLAAGDRLVPVRLDSARPPALLRALVTPSLDGLGIDEARRVLRQAVGVLSMRRNRPEFPGGRTEHPRTTPLPAPSFLPISAERAWLGAAAVLVGVHTYAHLADRPSVRRNIEDLKRVAATSFGVPRQRLFTVDNPADPRDILRAIEVAGRAAALSGGRLLVYYCGHAAPHPRTGALLLAVADSAPSEPYAYLDFNQLRDGVVRSQTRERLVIIDSCYSGGALDALSPADVPLPAIEGSFLMASSQASEISLAPHRMKNTAFTHALLEVLEHGIPETSPLLDAEAVFQAVRRICVRNSWPEPQRQVRNDGGRMVIIANAALRKNSDQEDLP